jgi:hypothetical protein
MTVEISTYIDVKKRVADLGFNQPDSLAIFCPGILMLLRPKMSYFMKNREPTSGLEPLT